MIVYQLYLNGELGYVVPEMELKAVMCELSDIEIGDLLCIKKQEMDEEAFENLKEFQGW